MVVEGPCEFILEGDKFPRSCRGPLLPSQVNLLCRMFSVLYTSDFRLLSLMAGVEGPVAMMSLVPTRVVSNSSALQHQRQQQQLGPPAAECCALDSCDVESFELGKTLGTGSFGRVRFATHKASGRHYALKMLKKAVIIRLKQVSKSIVAL